MNAIYPPNWLCSRSPNPIASVNFLLTAYSRYPSPSKEKMTEFENDFQRQIYEDSNEKNNGDE
ncbi:hypothetical protein [Arcticibacter sp.]|uniref:hypothetical protein n=1 Tax=Arcticibacter sp. TaxID=1872630 RepID=UPI00388E7965